MENVRRNSTTQKYGIKKVPGSQRNEHQCKNGQKILGGGTGGFNNQLEQSKGRTRKLSKYRDIILGWLKQFPEFSVAQVTDCLKEYYPLVEFRERTVRRFVARLREEYNIEKKTANRQYQAVADPPMGKQMQVDFGVTTMRKSTGRYIKIYGMGAVLSHSRYRYAQWSDRPLTTLTFIQMLSNCFDYIGGVPEELILDQDKLLAVSENHGDIIYTYEFEKFKQTMGFKVWLCRAGDPESKGRIEAFVKYMKRNFAANRLFIDLKIWNQCCEDWLERTANSRVHGITKKVPAEVFLEERQCLCPVPCTNKTLAWSSKLKKEAGILTLRGPLTDSVVATHKVSMEKGALIQNTHHLRDSTKKIDELYLKTLTQLGNTENAVIFLKAIRREKRRYVRDQCSTHTYCQHLQRAISGL